MEINIEKLLKKKIKLYKKKKQTKIDFFFLLKQSDSENTSISTSGVDIINEVQIADCLNCVQSSESDNSTFKK